MTVIGGFLGAGKTTLLLHWLQAAQGQRLAVLVNDFGALNIDAALVAERSADTIALSNGCVCCSIGDDLSAALGRVLDAAPAFDAVVIEASGVSDPWRIAQYALVDPQLRLDGVLVLVDASAAAAMAADPRLADTLQRPLAHADLVLLNKADLVDAGTLDGAKAWIARHAGPAPVLATVQAAVPLALVHGGALHRPRGGGFASAAHAAQFETWPGDADALPLSGPFDQAALSAWVRVLPPGVLRLKALLPLAGGGWAELQWAGRRGSLRRLPADSAAAQAGPMLAAIGLRGQLPGAALAEGLRGCI